MKTVMNKIWMLLPVLLLLSGCNPVGVKTMSLSAVYGATTVLSLLLLVVCCVLIGSKNSWFLLLFSSIFVVNCGYLSLSVSTALPEALLANRIAYFGSVLLPFAMLMIIAEACKLRISRWLTAVLTVLCFGVFLLTASPGYSTLYYESVSLVQIAGVSFLDKTYGPLHVLYLVYLLAYFSVMVVLIAIASRKNQLRSTVHAVSLTAAVLVNILVWLIGQLVSVDFEFLAISYIISEIFLLCIYLLQQSGGVQTTVVPEVFPAEPEDDLSEEREEAFMEESADDSDEAEETAPQTNNLEEMILRLTPTERTIFDLYISGQKPKDVMAILNIKENTLKYHNRNIYGKFEVSSRKQLVEFVEQEQQKAE